MCLMCMKCNEIYKNESNLNKCPKMKCNGDVVDIDENMILVIQILNKKGYYTEYCCSGHIYNYETDDFIQLYIKFVNPILLPNLPSGFNGDLVSDYKSKHSHTKLEKIFRKNEYLAKPDMAADLYDSYRDLIIWANNLPDCEHKIALMKK